MQSLTSLKIFQLFLPLTAQCEYYHIYLGTCLSHCWGGVFMPSPRMSVRPSIHIFTYEADPEQKPIGGNSFILHTHISNLSNLLGKTTPACWLPFFAVCYVARHETLFFLFNTSQRGRGVHSVLGQRRRHWASNDSVFDVCWDAFFTLAAHVFY